MENIRKMGGEENMRNSVKKQNGITLIALVVTIIVLIILAGVSIAMLVGENGIITQAQRAAQETEIKGDEEKIRLAMSAAQIENNGNSNIEKDDLEIALLENGTKSIVVDNEDGTRNIIFLDSKKIYKLNNDETIEDTNSDFDSIYVAPDTQDEPRNEGVIGIGTDGQVVDMDLWEYTFDTETKGYVLNDTQSYEASESVNASKGYLGEFTDTGKIQGSVPQYISINSGEEYIAVTNMRWTFFNCENLVAMPHIPSTIDSLIFTFRGCINLQEINTIPAKTKSMYMTFGGCTALEEAPEIPKGVANLGRTFSGCSSLIEAPVIPDTVTNMDSTFHSCSSLVNAPEIPSSVISMQTTFYQCTSLKNPPSLIPASVTNLYDTFYGCTNLSGAIIIEANVTGTVVTVIDGSEKLDYMYCFGDVATSQGATLTLKCTEEVYNLFYDASRSNKININVCGESSNITLEKL